MRQGVAVLNPPNRILINDTGAKDRGAPPLRELRARGIAASYLKRNMAASLRSAGFFVEL